MAHCTGFVGEFLHSVDQKGRAALPAKFRETLGPRFLICRGLDRCLFVYPTQEWQEILDKIKAMPLNQSDSRDYQRYFLSGASDVEPDKQGRIVLPASLREYASVAKDVWILGVGSRVEIWDKETWDNRRKTIEETFTQMAEGIASL